MIRLRGVSKRFGDKQVLVGVDLDVAEGETHVILGPSGTGKSVLLKLISGLMEPDAGTIEVDGQQLWPASTAVRHQGCRHIQMLFQGGALFDSMTVAQNVAFHAVEHGRTRPVNAEHYARPFLRLVNLEQAGSLTPAELSGGMRKRVGLARALAAEPRIMLYDEPTTGLDPLTSQTINQLIRETQRRTGLTSIVVTHDLVSAAIVGDRCSFLTDRILETVVPDQLVHSQHAIIRQFVEGATLRYVPPTVMPGGPTG